MTALRDQTVTILVPYVLPGRRDPVANSRFCLAHIMVVTIALGGCSEPVAVTRSTCATAPSAGQRMRGTYWPAQQGLTGVMAHRGFKCCFPENTVIAIEGALAMGADAIEVDVRFSQDGVPVLMHDVTVDRTTNGTGMVSHMTLEELGQLDACTWFDKSMAPCSVPTLDDALSAAGDTGRLALHIKDPVDRCALMGIAADVRHHRMTGRVAIASFDSSFTMRVRDSVPGLSTVLFVSAKAVLANVTMRHSEFVFLRGSLLHSTAWQTLAEMRARGVRLGAFQLDAELEGNGFESLGIEWVLSDDPSKLSVGTEGLATERLDQSHAR